MTPAAPLLTTSDTTASHPVTQTPRQTPQRTVRKRSREQPLPPPIEQPLFKVLCGNDDTEYTIPAEPKLRSELAKQLCAEYGGSYTVLSRYFAKPLDGRIYAQFKFKAPATATSCTDHRHLFDPDGNLHCVLPSVIGFGAAAGLQHPRDLHQVLDGSQSQCNGWRTDLELVVSLDGTLHQAFTC